jgi:Uncharacterized protein conserved in bacteria (DUF2332)
MARAAMRCDHARMTAPTVYAEFAARETHGISPLYERLSIAVSRDDEMLSLLGRLPPAKRQPNLLFGVVRFLGGPVDDPAAFHDYAVANWPVIEEQMCTRATQTNEAGRCAILLPVLATLPQPLALLDVGASAGLCLYPDCYSYRYGGHRIGAGNPVLDCAATGMALPARLPEVVWRAGLDLNPLDVTDPADLAWLEASSGRSTRTAAPGCRPLPPWPQPNRPCSCAATWSMTCPRWLRRHPPRRPWWSSTRRCCTRWLRRGGRRSSGRYARCRGAGSRTRTPMC